MSTPTGSTGSSPPSCPDVPDDRNETIERFLHSSYDQYATSATVPNHLPLLAERFARQRLRALARVVGHHRDGRPGTRYESWNVDDPAALDLVDVRPIRDEIERRVRRLLDQLNVPATRQPTTARRSGTATSQGRTD